jgi:hypothetical protein
LAARSPERGESGAVTLEQRGGQRAGLDVAHARRRRPSRLRASR